MDKREGKGLAIGAVIGAVIGVITGILFAPKSGKETRQDIRNTADKVASRLMDEADKIQDEMKELLEKVESKMKSTSGKASESAKEYAQKSRQVLTNLTAVAKAFRDGKASDKDLDQAIKEVKAAKDSLKTFLTK